MTSLKWENEHEGLASGSSETSTTIIWCERMMAATTSSSRVERSLTPRKGGLNVRNVADEIASTTKTKGFHRVKLGARTFLVSLSHIFIFNSAHFYRTQWSTQLQQVMDFYDGKYTSEELLQKNIPSGTSVSWTFLTHRRRALYTQMIFYLRNSVAQLSQNFATVSITEAIIPLIWFARYINIFIITLFIIICPKSTAQE